MPVALIAVAAVSAAGAIASSAIKGDAQRKSLNGQIDALKDMNDIDPKAYAELAKRGDLDAWKNRLDAMQKVDPQLADIRSSSLKMLTNNLARYSEAQGRTDDIAKTIYGMAQEYAAGAPAEMDLGSAFLDRAKERLGRGSELPPTFQAEMIRSGLESGGTTGVGANRKGPVAGVLGKLLGSAAVGMERQNEQDAAALANAGDQLSRNRMSILSGLLPQLQSYEAAQQNLAASVLAQGLNVVNNETPGKIGLSGADLVNLNETARQERNQKAMSIAQLKGQKEMARAEMQSGFAQSGTAFAQNIIGGLSGGTPGMMGGGQSFILPSGATQTLGYGGYLGQNSSGAPTVMRSAGNQALFDLQGQPFQ